MKVTKYVTKIVYIEVKVMPPDISGCVHKFIPNNAELSSVVIKILKNVYQTSTLPLPLVKQIVERAFEQSRMDMKPDSSVFQEKLTSYANQLRPRYLAKINEIRKRGSKW
ncbi:MAG TPA: hypothetical protein V6C52_01435 [Coleofasciculaceae cyanobacterium]|jgi:hypothetical protein